MGAREAGGSRFCAVVRCVSCVQSSDMLAEPPNTGATRPWPRGVAGPQRLVGSGSSPLDASRLRGWGGTCKGSVRIALLIG